MATKAVWNWFFPEQIFLPKCVRELLEFVYPDVDWDRVSFHEGMPHVVGVTDKSAITLPHPFRLNRIQIFFKPEKWDPCSCDGLGLIVHEGYHVLQIQGILDGFGLGLLNPTTILYLACWADNGFSYEGHPAEDEAYGIAGKPDSLFETCCRSLADLPCDCRCNPPSLNEVGLQDFKANCDKIVQQSSGPGFWERLAGCTPGLEAIADAARAIFNRTCRADAPPLSLFLACLFGSIISGLLWVIYGLYFVLWLVIWTLAALILALLDVIVGIIGGIISGIVGLVEGFWDAISSPFSQSGGWLWYTHYDTSNWQVPDVPITQNDRSKTGTSPAVAVFQANLYAAYRGRTSSDIWYNVFDGSNWRAEDIKITRDGRTRTNASPSLAVYDSRLFMAYKGASSNDLWYNFFDGSDWLAEDIKITKDGRTRTNTSPSLAVYENKLFMAYKGSSSNDILYNVFEGSQWLDEDIKITRDGRTRTSASPSLAMYNNLLFMAYKGATSSDIWYNVFDGNDWLDEDIQITKDGRTRTSSGPNLAVYDNKLFMVYRGASSSDIWYNYFDGRNWLDEDCRITQDGNIRTATRPAAADLNGLLYLVYRGAS